MFSPFVESDRLLRLTEFVNVVDYYRSPVSCESETKIPVLLRARNQHQTDSIQQYNERSNRQPGWKSQRHDIDTDGQAQLLRGANRPHQHPLSSIPPRLRGFFADRSNMS